MKKTLPTLGLAGMLAGSPSANAQIHSSKNETKKDLVEVMAKEQAALEEDGKTISFEDVKVLQENKQLIEEIMNDKKIQELINEYGEEKVQQIITEIITNKDTKEVIDKALKDKNIQKALQEGDREKIEKGVQKIAEVNDISKKDNRNWTLYFLLGGIVFTMPFWTDILHYEIYRWKKNRKEERKGKH